MKPCFKIVFMFSLMFSLFCFAQETVNFEDLEEYPYFEKCEKKFKKTPEDCFKYQLMKHFGKTFDYPELLKEKNIQGKYIVEGIIDKEGKIEVLQVIGNDIDDLMKNEIMRIFHILPLITPGKINGENVNTKFEFPIVLKLE
jgi:protein TonB